MVVGVAVLAVFVVARAAFATEVGWVQVVADGSRGGTDGL